MQTILGKHWHHLSNTEVIELLESDIKIGLDASVATLRQEHFGPNSLTVTKGQSAFVRFMLQFHQPLIYILLAAGLVTALLHEWVDSGVIMGVVFINAFIGYIQESKATNALAALAREMTTEATVIRGGQRRRIPAEQLVPGDTVLLQSGDKVPADMRLLHVRELQIDESALTGESVPTEKTDRELEQLTLLPDRKNMAYSSTLVTYGTGIGVVTATGDKTEIGQISKMISSAHVLATPLTKKIGHFSHILLYVILGLAAVTFLVGILRGESWFDMFMAAIALAVGAIPEGLPAAMTITLALGVNRMARRNAIIRKLPAVETLGSTTIICSDKTGTLTQNQMTVQEVLADDCMTMVSGTGYAPEGELCQGERVIVPSSNIALIECLRAGLLCNDSMLIHTTDGWRVEGDPTEGALLTSAHKAGLIYEEQNAKLPRIDTIPFESQHQYMATLHAIHADQTGRVYIKGSVESIVSRSSYAMNSSGELEELDSNRIYQRVDEMAGKGLRVLAFACTSIDSDTTSISHEDIQSGITFLGLQGMIDPPRIEAIEAIRVCQKAGIHVKMITGDHSKTAGAIARQIGLTGTGSTSSQQVVITGSDLNDMSDSELLAKIEQTVVFARVAPDQKLRLVQSLQELGHVVAMTGDGVNDAPALRRANIGIAMGLSGTEVAKEAADMVLTDDNFASIEAAVEEGRAVYQNLVKFITWTLPTNLGEGLVIFTAVILGVALPILPIQILWINMTTAVLLGLMLAFEPKEAGIMTRKPRDPRSPILSKVLIFRICYVGLLLLIGSFGLFKWALMNGMSEPAARTVAVNVFVVGELFYLFNCRSLTGSMFSIGVLSNKWLLAGVGVMITLQLLYTYSPLMNHAFQSEPIGVFEWALVICVGAVIYGIVGIEKWIRRMTSASE